MFNIFNTKIMVGRERPLEAQADALAIPANDHLWMGGGLAGTIKKDGGEEIEAEAVRQGPAQLGQTVATAAGQLKFKKLFHVVVAGQDLKTQTEHVEPAVTSLLGQVRQTGTGTVAVAPLESEENLKAFTETARAVVRALLANLGKKGDPKQITLLAVTDEGHEAYRHALHEAMRGAM